MDLDKKITQAITLIRAAASDKPIEVSYSGGKDSDVILNLAKEAGVDYRPIYKQTTIDPPGTTRHCLEAGAKIIHPHRSYFDIVAALGIPSRRLRFCCAELKEYKVMDTAIHGVRIEESQARRKRYTDSDPIVCRAYGRDHVSVCLPILTWTQQDVSEYINDRGIKCHPLYYDEAGVFHPERRLGCMGCPIAGVKAKLYWLKQYPGLVSQLVKAARRYWEGHPNAASRAKHHDDVYSYVAANLLYSKFANWQRDDNTLFGHEYWRARLEGIFGISL